MSDSVSSIEHIEKQFKQATCNHSAYKMLPIWGGIFGFCWECTQCGMIQQIMYIEEIKRGLRGEIKKRENEQYWTCETNIRQMCKDVLAKIEEQESMLAEKDKELRRQKYKRCFAMAQVLEHVCPMTNRKAKWRDKWHKRWLKIAEQFKPNNSTDQ